MATLRTLHMSEESRRLYSPTHYSVGPKSSTKSGATSNAGVSSGSGIWQTPSKPMSSAGVWGPPGTLSSAGSSATLKDQAGASSQGGVPAFVSGRSSIMPMPLTPMGANSAGSSHIPMTPPPGMVPRPLSRESLSSLASSSSSITSAMGPGQAVKTSSQGSAQAIQQPHHHSSQVQPMQSSQSAGHQHQMQSDHHAASRTTSVSSKDDEIIPTAIVVKNIPFAIKKEQLLDFMTQLGLTLPYAFNYHFDNGVFRGLAFANFTTSEETAVVISTLNGREIGGRKLRVEYKKMLPYQERERIEREKRERRGQLEEQHANATVGSSSLPSMSVSPSPSAPSSPMQQQITHPETLALLAQRTSSGSSATSQLTSTRVNMNDPETLSIYSSLLLFKNDATKAQIALGPALVSKQQIRLISALCKQLDLLSQTAEDGVVVAKRPDIAFVLPSSESSYLTGVFEHAVVVPTTSRHSSISSNSGSTSGAIASPASSPWAPRSQLPIGKNARSGDA